MCNLHEVPLDTVISPMDAEDSAAPHGLLPHGLLEIGKMPLDALPVPMYAMHVAAERGMGTGKRRPFPWPMAESGAATGLAVRTAPTVSLPVPAYPPAKDASLPAFDGFSAGASSAGQPSGGPGLCQAVPTGPKHTCLLYTSPSPRDS